MSRSNKPKNRRVVLDKTTMSPHKHGNDRAPKVKPPKIQWNPRESPRGAGPDHE